MLIGFNMRKKDQGFTLIELMIVVGVIGILSAISLPAYQVLVIRSQVAESIVLLDSAKVNTDDSVVIYGSFPSNQAELVALNTNILGVYGSITGVSDINDDAGSIIYKLSSSNVNKNIQNKSVWYTRTTLTGEWSCYTDLAQLYAVGDCTTISTAPIGS